VSPLQGTTGLSSSRQVNDTFGNKESVKEISALEFVLGLLGDDVILGAGTIDPADALIAKMVLNSAPLRATTTATLFFDLGRLNFRTISSIATS
jgi:hypothetical protein